MSSFKDIEKGQLARAKVKAGVDKAADAVKPTLGPVGMTALIEFKGLDPVLCDDGVTILRNLEFKDSHENMGLQMLRKGATRTSNEGGDGTATTTVLTQALVNEAFSEIANDSSKIREVVERLDNGLKETVDYLNSIKKEVKEDEIESIASISSLDDEVAKVIAEIIKDVGINGVVTVDKGSKIGYSKEVVKGARFDKGLISPYFINDHENKQTVLENPYIVLVDRKISMNEHILPLLNSIGTGKDILFIADDVDGIALGTLAHNAVNKIANIACVRNPYSASRGRDFLFDIASLTGATVISEEMGMKLEQQTVESCGRAEKVIVTRDTTTLIGGKGDTETRVKAIQNEKESCTSEYEKKMLDDRLAQLTGGIGVIRVGAYTDTDFHAKKFKFVNAINATQSALQEGVVAGGGIALANARYVVKETLFFKALQAPFRQMCKNAGIEEMPNVADFSSREIGIDFRTKEKVNMFESGVIDPVKTIRLAIEGATSIAKSLISVETTITVSDVDTTKDEK